MRARCKPPTGEIDYGCAQIGYTEKQQGQQGQQGQQAEVIGCEQRSRIVKEISRVVKAPRNEGIEPSKRLQKEHNIETGRQPQNVVSKTISNQESHPQDAERGEARGHCRLHGCRTGIGRSCCRLQPPWRQRERRREEEPQPVSQDINRRRTVQLRHRFG